MRIGICLPSLDYAHAWFGYDLAGMMTYTAFNHPDWELRRFQATGTWLPQVRHRTVVAALNTDCDWLLFLDSDMRFPLNTLEQMLARGKSVVAANYTARHVPFPPVAVNQQAERVYTEYESTGLEEVARIGMGVMLVRATELRRIKPPWFMLGWDDVTQDYTGEDNYFCRRLREEGTSIWLDHDLSHDVSHLGIIEFEQSHAVKMRHTLASSTSEDE